MGKLTEIFKKQGGSRLIKQYWKGGELPTAVAEFLILGRSKTALEILRLSANFKLKKKLRKKYKQKISDFVNNYKFKKSENKSKKVWVCWFQGIEQAPPLVQKCYQSLKEHLTDREIVLITENNYQEYVQFPEHIQKKIDSGIISKTHMSDLLRLELLLRYGGTWIDSTVYCTGGKIPSYMLDSDLFVFQKLKPGSNGNSISISSWFISSCADHPILALTKEMLYEYWSINNDMIDYFIFHYFFQLAIEQYPEEWKNVMPFCNSIPHILLLRLFEEYDENIWNAVKEMTPFHKLSYKFSDEQANVQGTYYKKIFK
ncbi:MAG: capsular polysaccharide synthesis protein [Oscillospiraceae bacterium]|nr:capsular polysaccharide synthesis protein [Oscillospiraceae bacterium]